VLSNLTTSAVSRWSKVSYASWSIRRLAARTARLVWTVVPAGQRIQGHPQGIGKPDKDAEAQVNLVVLQRTEVPLGEAHFFHQVFLLPPTEKYTLLVIKLH
jgi:hypothetical protein